MRIETWILLLLMAAPGAAQTARDMFHSASGLVVPAPAAPAKPNTPKPKPVAKPKAPPAPPAPVMAPGGPLGLRYSIVKETKEGGQSGVHEVDTDAVFHSGDRIRVAVESNDSAYLYVVTQGSSGTWSLLFPSPEIAGGDNRIEKGRRYEIPSGHWFAFDEQAGQERLFVVLCRAPEQDLEKMIYALRQGREEPKTLATASRAPIADAVVERVRSHVAARDLIFEKVDEKTAGGRPEQAVYVVNAAGGAQARVVADVMLKHQ
jgi:hypothetical protein